MIAQGHVARALLRTLKKPVIQFGFLKPKSDQSADPLDYRLVDSHYFNNGMTKFIMNYRTHAYKLTSIC